LNRKGVRFWARLCERCFFVWNAAVWVVVQFDCGRVRGWKIDGRSAYSRDGAIVQCNCGAEYRRIEEKFLVPHTGDAICTVCGAALESWRENTNSPKKTGHDPAGDFLPLGEARQPGGKVVQARAIEGDWDPALIRSNTFEQQYLRDGVAAALWTPTDLSGDRPRGLVWYRRRATEDPEGTNGFRRSIG
jgi:hypothetical protein